MRMLAAAQAEVGHAEHPPGSNDGPRLGTYRAAVAGAAAGQPWCAYFVSWVAAQAGAPLGVRLAGLKTLASCRMEKGYRDYGHDIDNTDNAFETGLGFFVDLKKPGGFIGREAAAKQKAAAPWTRRLVQVLVKDPEPMLFHAEVVLRDGKPVGYVRAASYGHTLGGAVGLAMIEAGEPVDAAYLAGGRWEVDIAGKRYPAAVSLRPLYDPEMTRIKA